jgi:hypothetical protein
MRSKTCAEQGNWVRRIRAKKCLGKKMWGKKMWGEKMWGEKMWGEKMWGEKMWARWCLKRSTGNIRVPVLGEYSACFDL